MTSASISLYLHTLRHLKPQQLVLRLTKRTPRPIQGPAPALRERLGPWTAPVIFEPLELTRPCRLRDYTLHYHRNPSIDGIEQWIHQNPPGKGAGWEPYPLSLRIPNWLKWYLTSGDNPSRSTLESLATQAHYLSQTVEHHLLANHLFVNGKALVFAGSFFAHNGWLRQGLAILSKEIPEQVLEDGGHFERSPMYHCLILEDMLDLINLGRTYPGLLPDWSPVAIRMVSWLEQMIHPDGHLPYFNDTAVGVAPGADLLFHYAARLALDRRRIVLSDSGYIRLENGQTVVLFDAGPIGPDYNPAHAHADTLSFELSHRGQRLIVNSGTSTYDACELRQWQRGTAAHNTVRVDRVDQSEVWKAFRVARRAYPLDVRTDHQTFAEASHDGYRRLQSPVVHQRRIELNSNVIRVTDVLAGSGLHAVEVFFHLTPGIVTEIGLDSKLHQSRESTHFYPAFEHASSNQTVVGSYIGTLPAEFVTKIHPS